MFARFFRSLSLGALLLGGGAWAADLPTLIAPPGEERALWVAPSPLAQAAWPMPQNNQRQPVPVVLQWHAGEDEEDAATLAVRLVESHSEWCWAANSCSDQFAVDVVGLSANWEPGLPLRFGMNLDMVTLDAPANISGLESGTVSTVGFTLGSGVELGQRARLLFDINLAERFGNSQQVIMLTPVPGNNSMMLAPLGVDEQAALGLGLSIGRFTGMLTGRIYDPSAVDWSSQLQPDFDISVAWRTPWEASVQIGARNVTDNDRLPPTIANRADSDDLFGRVPYIRYTQDL